MIIILSSLWHRSTGPELDQKNTPLRQCPNLFLNSLLRYMNLLRINRFFYGVSFQKVDGILMAYDGKTHGF